jgi:hypothetical protein
VELLVDVIAVESTDPDPYQGDPFFFRNLALRALYSLCVLHPAYRAVVAGMGARQPLQAFARNTQQTSQEVRERYSKHDIMERACYKSPV